MATLERVEGWLAGLGDSKVLQEIGDVAKEEVERDAMGVLVEPLLKALEASQDLVRDALLARALGNLVAYHAGNREQVIANDGLLTLLSSMQKAAKDGAQSLEAKAVVRNLCGVFGNLCHERTAIQTLLVETGTLEGVLSCVEAVQRPDAQLLSMACHLFLNVSELDDAVQVLLRHAQALVNFLKIDDATVWQPDVLHKFEALLRALFSPQEALDYLWNVYQSNGTTRPVLLFFLQGVEHALEYSNQNPSYVLVMPEGLAEAVAAMLQSPDMPVLTSALEVLMQMSVYADAAEYITGHCRARLMELLTTADPPHRKLALLVLGNACLSPERASELLQSNTLLPHLCSLLQDEFLGDSALSNLRNLTLFGSPNELKAARPELVLDLCRSLASDDVKDTTAVHVIVCLRHLCRHDTYIQALWDANVLVRIAALRESGITRNVPFLHWESTRLCAAMAAKASPERIPALLELGGRAMAEALLSSEFDVLKHEGSVMKQALEETS